MDPDQVQSVKPTAFFMHLGFLVGDVVVQTYTNDRERTPLTVTTGGVARGNLPAVLPSSLGEANLNEVCARARARPGRLRARAGRVSSGGRGSQLHGGMRCVEGRAACAELTLSSSPWSRDGRCDSRGCP